MYTIGIYDRDDGHPDGGVLLGYFHLDRFISLEEVEELRQREAIIFGSSFYVYVVAARIPLSNANAALLADIELRNQRSRAGLEGLKARMV